MTGSSEVTNESPYKRASRLIRAVEQPAELCRRNEPHDLAAGLRPAERAYVARRLAETSEWARQLAWPIANSRPVTDTVVAPSGPQIEVAAERDVETVQ
jgi:hypothetical protein